MKHTEKYMAECTKTVKETCDLCGDDILDNFPGDFENVELRRYELKHEAGARWSDSGNLTSTGADICGKCFREKVRPALEAIGVKFQVNEVDW